ncbi:hypothetical protein A8F94_14560 [Bacillus sp. FJAT-27225]|uniref:hypothetical protein n=1 Tax=Bacillus sp. FJAT-27225 TaxID=1743144 RepID=UPI00080C2EBC|nr:hypothetical protein [Bacillus sp. FJAT-27225]OCA86060.1 hypothetical protein A8F94_14560 [Bacillus sp. FJAT-27225]
MKVIKYRKSVAFSRFLIALGAVVLGLLLIFVAADDPDALLYRKIMYYAGGFVSIGFFGPMLILLTFVLFKNPTMFSYDAQKIVIDSKEMKRTDLWKVELSTLPTGILGTKVPGFSVYTKDKQKVNILTYYVLSKKEHDEIFKALKQYISNHKSAVN